MKVLTLIFLIIVISSCGIIPESKEYIFKDNTVDLSPPDWILGTWEDEIVIYGFKFVSDDFFIWLGEDYHSLKDIYLNLNDSCKLDAGKYFIDCSFQYIITDISSDSLYTVNREKRRQYDDEYVSTTIWKFEKLSDNTIKYSEVILTKVI